MCDVGATSPPAWKWQPFMSHHEFLSKMLKLSQNLAINHQELLLEPPRYPGDFRGNCKLQFRGLLAPPPCSRTPSWHLFSRTCVQQDISCSASFSLKGWIGRGVRGVGPYKAHDMPSPSYRGDGSSNNNSNSHSPNPWMDGPDYIIVLC